MIVILSKFELIESGLVQGLNYTKDDVITDSYITALGFIILAFISFASNYLQIDMFNRVGEDITLKLRKELFTSIVNKDMEFFDREENNPGVLASKLGKDCALVNSSITTGFGAYAIGISCVMIGLSIAYYTYWRLALIGSIGCPLIIIAGIIESKMTFQISTSELDDEDEKDNTFASDVRLLHEASTKMKTVSSINCQNSLVKQFGLIVRKK